MYRCVSLQKADSDFFDDFFRFKSEEKNIYWSGHSNAPNYKSLKSWYLNEINNNENRIIFKILYLNESVGYLYCDILENELIELSYAIKKSFEGKGIGTDAVKEAINFIKKSQYKNYTIRAFVANNNIASKKIMDKIGFRKTSKTYKQILKKTNEEVLMREYIYHQDTTFIIAEAGVNHNGDINLAKKLIDTAVDAGVDAVKFQTWKTELLVTKDAKQAEYQTENTKIKETQYDMLKRLELSYDDFRELKQYCDSKNIIFLSTPDEFESADFLTGLQETFKIGSGEITNLPYLRHIGKLGKKVILSTGMADMGEIEDALDVLVEAGTKKENITVLHANTMYPTPIEDVNLKAMQTIACTFGVDVGYSDHTLGIEVPIAAVAMGAKVIEKHFTLDKTMEGPDHKASLEPEELKAMVKAIRSIEKALGTGIKKPSKSEEPNMIVVRKSIVASKPIKKGEVFSKDNLTVKRPGDGISPIRWDDIAGTVAQKDYEVDEKV